MIIIALVFHIVYNNLSLNGGLLNGHLFNRRKSRSSARFTVVTGRRRVGKTQLIKRAMEDEPYLYLYVSRKAEKDLCRGFQEEIAAVLGLPLKYRTTHFAGLSMNDM